jgi:hypothetical protein
MAVRSHLVTSLRPIAPEAELKRWFSWQWYWDDAIIEKLVGQGRRLVRVAGHLTAAEHP